jgi:biopolymer transport protein ExbD
VKLLRRERAAGHSPRAEINVTPLVDVVLVLLIIFMVVTPFLEPIEVMLPQAEHAEPSEELPVVLTLHADGSIYFQEERIALADLGRLTSARGVLVRADGDLGFGTVRLVMEELAIAGVTGVDLATVPPEPR